MSSKGIEGADRGPQIPASDAMVKARAAMGETPELTQLASGSSLNNDSEGYGLLFRLQKHDLGFKADQRQYSHRRGSHRESHVSQFAFKVVTASGKTTSPEALNERQGQNVHQKKKGHR